MNNPSRLMILALLASLSGCAGLGGFGGNNSGGYGYPGYGGYGGYGYPSYRQPQWNPPVTQTQKDLNTINDNMDKLSKLPPDQQQAVIKKAKELQEKRDRELDRYSEQSRGRW